MIEGLIGKKIGMTQGFDEEGNAVPLTVIQAGPCTVIQKKSKDKDGYEALQLGFVEDKGRETSEQGPLGHFKKSGSPADRSSSGIPIRRPGEVKEGDQFFVDVFKVGERSMSRGRAKARASPASSNATISGAGTTRTGRCSTGRPARSARLPILRASSAG